MDKINIFDEVKQGEFFSFKNIGDSIQGTYIDARYNQIDSFQNQQNIYVIQDAEGKIWNIGFKLTNKAGNERMKQIRFGQIVGFRFDREQESKQPGRNKAKIILIYADPKFINEEWLIRISKIYMFQIAQIAQIFKKKKIVLFDIKPDNIIAGS